MPSLFIVAAIEKIARQSVFGKKRRGIVLPMISVKSCQEKIWEEKVLVYLEKRKMRHNIKNRKIKLKNKKEKASAFETARNPGNF